MGDPQLSLRARQLIEEMGNLKLVSIVSPWEIAIKTSLGKLTLTEPFDVLIPRELAQAGFVSLAIEIFHLNRLISLPLYHRDPFDRMLIAQAIGEEIPILSVDRAFDAYPVTRLW